VGDARIGTGLQTRHGALCQGKAPTDGGLGGRPRGPFATHTRTHGARLRKHAPGTRGHNCGGRNRNQERTWYVCSLAASMDVAADSRSASSADISFLSSSSADCAESVPTACAISRTCSRESRSTTSVSTAAAEVWPSDSGAGGGGSAGAGVAASAG
jgi:hypothetical protein